jgi:inorganic phosphate transporter, PiT family
MSEGVAAKQGMRGPAPTERHPLHSSPLPTWTGQAGPLIAFGVLAIGAAYAASGLLSDMAAAPSPGMLIYTLLGIALLIALGFEFVNGFHDTANAVATVIYTHSLPAYFAVIWSGLFNFLGVLMSTGGGRQEARPPQLHPPPASPNPLWRHPSRSGPSAGSRA